MAASRPSGRLDPLEAVPQAESLPHLGCQLFNALLPSNSRTTDSQDAAKSAESKLLCTPSRGLRAGSGTGGMGLAYVTRVQQTRHPRPSPPNHCFFVSHAPFCIGT
jgi:hypothetical protein